MADEKPETKPLDKAPAVAVAPAPPTPEKPKRYIVEEETRFEILGSTITYRQNQIITNEREIKLAIEQNVPLREMTPVR